MSGDTGECSGGGKAGGYGTGCGKGDRGAAEKTQEQEVIAEASKGGMEIPEYGQRYKSCLCDKWKVLSQKIPLLFELVHAAPFFRLLLSLMSCCGCPATTVLSQPPIAAACAAAARAATTPAADVLSMDAPAVQSFGLHLPWCCVAFSTVAGLTHLCLFCSHVCKVSTMVVVWPHIATRSVFARPVLNTRLGGWLFSSCPWPSQYHPWPSFCFWPSTAVLVFGSLSDCLPQQPSLAVPFAADFALFVSIPFVCDRSVRSRLARDRPTMPVPAKVVLLRSFCHSRPYYSRSLSQLLL